MIPEEIQKLLGNIPLDIEKEKIFDLFIENIKGMIPDTAKKLFKKKKPI